MGITDDRNDPRLGRGSDDAPTQMNEAYLVLSEKLRKGDFVRPVLESYQHETCNSITWMNRAIAETYAKSPGFYGSTWCAHCQMHRPVGVNGEFVWCGTDMVTWEPGGVMMPSEDVVTANRLKVGT